MLLLVCAGIGVAVGFLSSRHKHQVLASYVPIAATATGGTFVVIAICRVSWKRLQRRAGNSEEEAAEIEDKENVAVGAVEAMAGLALYSAGKGAWSRGPLRGGLSVFGASPELDSAASRERYLAEKLADFSGSVTGGVASLVHLSRLQVEDGEVRESVAAMIRYARRSAGVQNLLVAPEIGEAWAEFAAQVQAHRQDMKNIASHVYYPSVPGIGGANAHQALMIVNATDPVVRFARSAKDCVGVLSSLVADLGSARGGLLACMLSSLTLGAAVGCEAAAWMPA